jgi:hypothetical protein
VHCLLEVSRALSFLSHQVEFGINDLPVVPFSVGEMLGEIPQSEENLDLRCKTGIYNEVSSENVGAAVARGNMLSNSFVIWQEGSKARKGRFIVNWPSRASTGKRVACAWKPYQHTLLSYKSPTIWSASTSSHVTVTFGSHQACVTCSSSAMLVGSTNASPYHLVGEDRRCGSQGCSDP